MTTTWRCDRCGAANPDRYRTCGACGRARGWTHHGQVLVEYAIVATITLPLLLVTFQLALLMAYHVAQQQANGTLAAVAASDGRGAAFDAALVSESARIGCDGPVAVVETPVPELVTVGLRCTWRAPIYRDASWPVSTTASAPLTPTPTPEAIP